MRPTCAAKNGTPFPLMWPSVASWFDTTLTYLREAENGGSAQESNLPEAAFAASRRF
jgi:hypothetical protein